VAFLEPFKEVTTVMSGSTYPTLSMTIPLFNYLVDHIEDTIGDEGDENDNEEEEEDDENNEEEQINKLIKKAAKYCKSKLLKYYNKTNDSYLISIILDSCFKMQYFKDEDWDDKLIDEINQKYVLFNCFKNFCLHNF